MSFRRSLSHPQFFWDIRALCRIPLQSYLLSSPRRKKKVTAQRVIYSSIYLKHYFKFHVSVHLFVQVSPLNVILFPHPRGPRKYPGSGYVLVNYSVAPSLGSARIWLELLAKKLGSAWLVSFSQAYFKLSKN